MAFNRYHKKWERVVELQEQNFRAEKTGHHEYIRFGHSDEHDYVVFKDSLGKETKVRRSSIIKIADSAEDKIKHQDLNDEIEAMNKVKLQYEQLIKI